MYRKRQWKRWWLGILIYQSQSGDAETGTSTFNCDSSTIEIISSSSVYSSAPFFYVTNTDAIINIKECTLKFGSGQFLLIDEDDWGTNGSNGDSVTMTLTNQDIEGGYSNWFIFFFDFKFG